MRVYEASTLISAEFGGIRDLSRHLSLNLLPTTESVLFSSRKLTLSRIISGSEKNMEVS